MPSTTENWEKAVREGFYEGEIMELSSRCKRVGLKESHTDSLGSTENRPKVVVKGRHT